MTKWVRARKKPIVIRFRAVEPNATTLFDGPVEWIKTREGELKAIPDKDFVIEGIEGELYPIKKEIFHKTYDIIDTFQTSSRRPTEC